MPAPSSLNGHIVDPDCSGRIGGSLDRASRVGAVHLARDHQFALIEIEILPPKRPRLGRPESVPVTEIDQEADGSVGHGEHEADRLVVLSAAGVNESWKQVPWSSRLLFRTMLRNVFADHHAQEDLVEQSPLDWTIVRAAVLKDDPAIGAYTATNTGKIGKINRADVAACLVDQLDDPANSRQAISVTS